jgi:C4-dicarboxylate-specific signal transduction histidine kinase
MQLLAILTAVLVQAALIWWLVYEHRRRHLAEVQSRNAMSELTYLNRQAAAGELSAAIAHEVNQPLTGIVMRAGAARRWLARENPDLGKVREALDQIESAGHRAGEIVKNVKSMFKRDLHDRTEVNINKLIGTVLGLVNIDLRKHQIEVQTELNDLAPVFGNDVQLQQVILNLVMNAVDAMRSSDLRMLSVKSKPNGRDSVNVSIEDTGTGIDPLVLNRIFSPLFTTKENGMGLGLSICQTIIESHDGRIWVSPGAKRGSIFQFELPIKSTKNNSMTA